MGVFCELFGERWQRDIGSAQYSSVMRCAVYLEFIFIIRLSMNNLTESPLYSVNIWSCIWFREQMTRKFYNFGEVFRSLLTSCLLAGWRHQMETFSTLLAFCVGNSPVTVNSPLKGQWREVLIYSFIYAWMNGWVNNRDAGDLRRHRTHRDVIVMECWGTRTCAKLRLYFLA